MLSRRGFGGKLTAARSLLRGVLLVLAAGCSHRAALPVSVLAERILPPPDARLPDRPEAPVPPMTPADKEAAAGEERTAETAPPDPTHYEVKQIAVPAAAAGQS